MPELHVTWIVLGGHGERADEARQSAERFLVDAGRGEVVVHGFRDAFMPYAGEAIKEIFDELKSVRPDLVLTHSRQDLHQDHRLASELTWNTFRDHLILEYEIPKYDGDLGSPNTFVPISAELAREKAAMIVQGFPSQAEKHWFDEELFLGLMRIRGMEAGSESGYAEAYYARKLSVLV